MQRLIIAGVVIILIIGTILFLNSSKEKSKTVTTSGGEEVTTGLSDSVGKAEEGKQAPNFTLVDFEGEVVKLSDLKGKPVFIDFWTKWCPFCTDEMPQIEKIHKEFGPPSGGELVVIGIHRTNTESASVGKDFARGEIKVTYTILQDKTDEVYKAYTPSFAGMPVAAWIDKNGILKKLKIGPKTTEEMRSNTQEIL
jgi:peroxiredoxin